MSEAKRATWREFVEWLRRKRSDKDGELRRAAPEAQTRGEAAFVCRFVMGLGRTSTGRLVDEWFSWLRAQGIEPPADPPSVAEVLERVAADMDNAANVSQATDASDYFRGFDAGQASAYADAAGVLRARAKEFT